jgi:type IV secretory pathway VirB2 component (pilin)
VALAAIGFVTTQVIWIPAFATFLIAVTLFLVPSTGSVRVDGLDSAPGEVGAAAKSVQFGLRHLAPLIFSLMVLVGSSWFVSMVIFSLLAIPVMFGGAIAVGLALVCIPGPSKSFVSGPSKWLGSLMILIGSAGMMVILFTMSSMLGGRRSPEPGETRTILAITGGGWLAVVGIIAVGLGLRGSDRELRRNVCWILLATWVLALGFGSMIWPILPKSL